MFTSKGFYHMTFYDGTLTATMSKPENSIFIIDTIYGNVEYAVQMTVDGFDFALFDTVEFGDVYLKDEALIGIMNVPKDTKLCIFSVDVGQ